MLIAPKLAVLITGPILYLTETVQKVRGRQDFALRADASRQDEIGSLATSFNDMLQRIQQQEEALRLAQQELRQSLDHAIEANRHKSKFLSTMSHELRTPLNAILGFTELMKNQFHGDLNEKQMAHVIQIDASGQHLLDLINDLLDTAQIDAGTMSLELAPCSFREIQDATLAMLETQFKNKSLEVDSQSSSVLPPIMADERKIKQILINLLSNAIKFTPENGRIDVSAVSEGETVRISVSDTGEGVSNEQQKLIFSEFHQVAKAREEILHGVGLGLPLTKRLVELHGGTMGMESVVNRGSTFWFTIPTAASETDRPEPEGDYTEELYPTGRRILLVEDNQANLELMTEMLAIYDHRVAVARNGQEAIDKAQEFDPDLILMDVRMPVMDGLEATQRLRTIPAFHHTPILGLTADTESDLVQRCYDAGMTAHMLKPVTLDSFFPFLNQHLK